jgi:hypothetical protein
MATDEVTDNELLTEVRAALRDEVADVTASPALLAAVRRRHRRLRSARRWGLTAVPAGLAALAAVVVLTPGAPPPGTGGGPHSATGTVTPEPVNAAYVRERTSAALGTVTDAVIYERAVAPEGEKYFQPGEEGLSERWHAGDGSAFRYRASVAGTPVVDLSRDTVSDVFVDHRARTYRVAPGVEPSAPAHDSVLTPEEIRQELADGSIAVVGPGEAIGGKPTVKLHREPRRTDVATDLWVDATTYLPVRWQWLQEGSTPFDVAWLPPTPENLAQLTTVVPPGYARQP